MARRLKWVARAADDLAEITEYVAEDSPAAARRLARDLTAAARSLTGLSDRGRLVPELRHLGLREILIGAYRLIYRVQPEAVVIVAVVHGARDLEALWEREGRPGT